MEERRKTPRIKEENEVTIIVVSDENNFPKEKIINNFTKDISAGGAKLQTNILLPVDTLIELEFTSKGLRQQINAIGKVKWVKVIIEDEYYEAGVEFTSSNPSDAINKLEDYVTWKLKSNKSEFIKKKISPIDSGDKNIIQVEEATPTFSVDNKTSATEETLPIDSFEMKVTEAEDIPAIDSSDKTLEETKDPSSIKKKQWSEITLLLLCTIILIVTLVNQFNSFPEFDKVINYLGYNSITTEPKAIPAPPIASSAQEATPLASPEETPPLEQGATPPAAIEAANAPAIEAAQKIKVIGNSDSKKYHLPGMQYYNAIKAYHRVEFDSETDAIKAGYRKANK